LLLGPTAASVVPTETGYGEDLLVSEAVIFHHAEKLTCLELITELCLDLFELIPLPHNIFL
jgi:hypothetical protein